jgi:hypothetical protein
VPQSSVLSPTLCNLYINDIPQGIGVNLSLFTDDTCLYATERKEDYVLRKSQRGLYSMTLWCMRWNINMNAEKNRAIYFSHQIRPPETTLILAGRNIPFVNSVIFDDKITWRLQ